jgi:hypothetical protein
MSKPRDKINLKATQDTVLKQVPIDSRLLKEAALTSIESGQKFTAIRLGEEKNHYHLEFETPINGQHCWYAFIGHWQIESANPEADPVITFAQKPSDRGKQFQVPGLANPIYLNEPISAFAPNFFWYEALHGGERIPTEARHTENIIKIAAAAQVARDKIGKPFKITSWYRPEPFNSRAGGASNSTHKVGLAIDFLVEGMTGKQLAKVLADWKGGMGIYRRFPNLLHLDARVSRARWGGA